MTPGEVLARGLAGLVLLPEWEEQFGLTADDTTARLDDASWHRAVHGAFTWQLFADWWASRRWAVPRSPERVEYGQHWRNVTL